MDNFLPSFTYLFYNLPTRECVTGMIKGNDENEKPPTAWVYIF